LCNRDAWQHLAFLSGEFDQIRVHRQGALSRRQSKDIHSGIKVRENLLKRDGFRPAGKVFGLPNVSLRS